MHRLKGTKLRLSLAMAAGALVIAVLAYVLLPPADAVDFSPVASADWQIEAWGGAEVDGNADGAMIAADSPPGGLFLRRTLDPQRKYRLMVSGDGEPDAPATLRITIDDEDPQWLAAPSGTTEMVVSAARDIELLVYADAPFTYLLRSVALEECPVCLVDAELKENLLRELPGLEGALATDPLRAAEILTDWTARQVDLGVGTLQDWILPAMSAAQIYTDVWQADAGGGSCGAFSVFNDKILKLFGLNSFTINFGALEGDLTHVSTILALPGSDGRFRFYLFDPTFDATYRRPGTGEYLDFATVLLEHPNNRVFAFTRRPFTRAALFTEATLDRVKPYLAPELIASCGRAGENDELYLCPDFDYLRYFDTYSHPESWASKLPRFGIAPGEDVIATLTKTRVFSIGEALDPAATEQFRELLAELGIPYGYE